MHDTLSTLCTAAAEIIPPCGTAMLLIMLHVSALLCHKMDQFTINCVHTYIVHNQIRIETKQMEKNFTNLRTRHYIIIQTIYLKYGNTLIKSCIQNVSKQQQQFFMVPHLAIQSSYV